MAKSTLEIIRRPIEEIPQWDDFVSRSPQGTIFQSSKYLSVVSGVLNRRVEIIGLTKAGNLVAAVVLLPQKKSGLSYATSPFYLPYNGIMVGSEQNFKHFRNCRRNI